MADFDPEQLKYPIGLFNPPKRLTKKKAAEYIDQIDRLPLQLEMEIAPLKEEFFAWRYREAGWTIGQVVNHIADSHMNALCRIKLCMTEDHPTIRPYQEAKWARLVDSKLDSVTSSMMMIHGIHNRMVRLGESLDLQDLKKTCYHPESKQTLTLGWLFGQYAWHGKHHLAHIMLAKEMKRSS